MQISSGTCLAFRVLRTDVHAVKLTWSTHLSLFLLNGVLFRQSQASICKTVRRMISVVLWVATLVAMLLVFGVNLNTVLVSGAASISALVVALSRFLLSAMF